MRSRYSKRHKTLLDGLRSLADLIVAVGWGGESAAHGFPFRDCGPALVVGGLHPHTSVHLNAEAFAAH
jgi:hypothetical protein